MKKYLSILVLFSSFNSISAMIVDTCEVDASVEKLYLIEAENGEIVQFSQSLVGQCGTIKKMIDVLGHLSEDETIEVFQPSQSLQLLVDFHEATKKNKEKSLKQTLDLFKVADFLDYKFKIKFTDGIVSRITPMETLKDILMNKISLAIAGEEEAMIVERLFDVARPLIAQYCLSNSTPETLSSHIGTIMSFCVTPDVSKVITHSLAAVVIWDTKTGICVQTFCPDHSYDIDSVCVTPDSSKVVTWSKNEVKIWDVKTGRCEHTFSGSFSEIIDEGSSSS